MLIVAARMPQYCALVGVALALVCSAVAGVPALVALERAILAMIAFAYVGGILGLLLAGSLKGRR